MFNGGGGGEASRTGRDEFRNAQSFRNREEFRIFFMSFESFFVFCFVFLGCDLRVELLFGFCLINDCVLCLLIQKNPESGSVKDI